MNTVTRNIGENPTMWSRSDFLGLCFRTTFLGLCFGPACLLPGCAPARSAATPARPGLHVIIGPDTSGSFRSSLPNAVTFIQRLAARLDPDADLLTALRVDNVASEFYDQPPPQSERTFRILLNSTLTAAPSHNGTYPARFFSEAARRVALDAQAGRASVIVFVSDGDQDADPRLAEPKLRAAGDALAANPTATVICVGFLSINHAAWRRRFAGLEAADRLYFRQLDRTALDQVSQIIEACRTKAETPKSSTLVSSPHTHSPNPKGEQK